MKHLFWFLIVGLIFIGCADDVIVEPPAGLRGAYEGTYTIIKNYGSGSGDTETSEDKVEWTFTDQRFFCVVDTIATTDITVCDFSGNYELLSNGNVLFKDTLVSPGTCDHDDIAVNEFSLTPIRVEDGADTLKFEQLSGTAPGQTLKSIELVEIIAE